MSKRHRDHGDAEHHAAPASGHAAGKRARTDHLKSRGGAASTNAPTAAPGADEGDVIGAGDLGPRAPQIAEIIDFVGRDDGTTLITVRTGRAQKLRPFAIASVVSPDDAHRKIAAASVVQILDHATQLSTTASIAKMEDQHAVVKLEDDVY